MRTPNDNDYRGRSRGFGLEGFTLAISRRAFNLEPGRDYSAEGHYSFGLRQVVAKAQIDLPKGGLLITPDITPVTKSTSFQGNTCRCDDTGK